MTKIVEAFGKAGIRKFLDVRAFCEAPPFCLRVREQGPLYGLRYDRGASDFRSPIVRQARGIVLEKESNRIVSWAFDKFYEYGEDAPSYRERPNLRRSVSDPSVRYERKYDGVLIKVVRRPGGELLVSTNGKIDAGNAPLHAPASFNYSVADGDLAERQTTAADAGSRSLREVFAEAGGLLLPYQEGNCYSFELLHPEIPTVAPAKSTRLVHLATRQLSGSFQELSPETRFQGEHLDAAEVLHFRSFGACREEARGLPWDEEGFVLVESTGSRVKVKSEAYMAMQRLLAGDSDSRDCDALAVALTLHRATTPLPLALQQLILGWRKRLEALASSIAARAQGSKAYVTSGQSARLEAGLGGRIPRRVRSVLAGAIVDWIAGGGTGPCCTDEIILALRLSRLPVSEILAALQLSAR